MSSASQAVATLEDLARVDGKAELIGGRIVHLMPTGFLPNRVAARIFGSLDAYCLAAGRGFALTDNMGYAVGPLSSGRQSFSPDASYYDGPLPRNTMRFLERPPNFAVEVRSEGDYGPAAELEISAKRADYFEAGTLVVWDVDPIAETIRSYRAESPEDPEVFRRGQRADAGPALPGWSIALDDIFA